MIAALLEAVAIAVVAGVGVTTLFSVVVLAGARSVEARRGGHAVRIALWYTVCAVALAAFATVVVLGVHVMLAKLPRATAPRAPARRPPRSGPAGRA